VTSAEHPDLLADLDRVADLVREMEAIIVVHPADVTPELRAKVEATPHAELRISKWTKPGTALVIHPRLLEDICGR
jgi:hypothetical protein